MKGIRLTEKNQIEVSVKRDSEGMIVSGMVIDNIDAQRCRIITEMHPGELKEYPILGFGISKYINKVGLVKQQFINELQKQLAIDEINAKVLVDTNNNFQIEIQ